jgi:hypothetical protein
MGGNASSPPPAPADDPDEERVVPARAVLTELARGFLLVQESNPARARQFALTFLKEHATPTDVGRAEVGEHVTSARRALGRYPRGAVEPLPARLPP